MMSTHLLDYLLFTLLILLFLGPPIYLWIRWILRAIKNKRRVGLILSILSFVLFVSGIIIMWFGPEKPFVHNAIRVTHTGAYLVFHFALAFSIPLVYFCSRWLYQAVKSIRS